MCDLPESRLAIGEPPFIKTAVDYFGPIEVSGGRGKEKKTWEALFTRMTMRAVYLDLALSLTTDQFLLIFRCFFGIYGKPHRIHSDNGTNFVKAERVLRKVVLDLHESKGLADFMQCAAIEWTFQPAKTPHSGGDILLWNWRKEVSVILRRSFCAHCCSK